MTRWQPCWVTNSAASSPFAASFTRYPFFSSIRPTNLRTLIESSATTITRSCSTRSMTWEGMLPRAMAVEPGAKIRAGPALAWLCRCHAVQVDQQNEAAIGRDRCAREEFHPAQVFAQVLDNDFIFAHNLFHDEANLPVSGICHHHPEVFIERFESRQTQIDRKSTRLNSSHGSS